MSAWLPWVIGGALLAGAFYAYGRKRESLGSWKIRAKRSEATIEQAVEQAKRRAAMPLPDDDVMSSLGMPEPSEDDT